MIHTPAHIPASFYFSLVCDDDLPSLLRSSDGCIGPCKASPYNEHVCCVMNRLHGSPL